MNSFVIIKISLTNLVFELKIQKNFYSRTSLVRLIQMHTKNFKLAAIYEKGVYYSLAVWRFKPILSAGLRFHSHLSGGLRLRNYRAVGGNHKFSSRFSVFACFCGGYSNRVKGLRRLSGNFVLLNLLTLTKDCLLGLDQVSQGFPLCLRPCGEGWRGNLMINK